MKNAQYNNADKEIAHYTPRVLCVYVCVCVTPPPPPSHLHLHRSHTSSFLSSDSEISTHRFQNFRLRRQSECLIDEMKEKKSEAKPL